MTKDYWESELIHLGLGWAYLQVKDVGHDYGIVLMIFSNSDAECVEDCRGKSYKEYILV